MILIRFTGGLGNQLFQYALGYHLAKKNNTLLKYDDSIITNRSSSHEIVTHRTLDIADVFGIDLKKATEEEVIYFNGKANPRNLADRIWNGILWRLRKQHLVLERSRSFDGSILELGDNKCIVGSWQSERYFSSISSEIKRLFAFREPLLSISEALVKKIDTNNSVCLHVRRGDYVTSPLYSKTIGALPMEYYENACLKIMEKVKDPCLFVFSDDINWCKENLKLTGKHYFVADEHAGVKASNYLQLMTCCKHYIISNSTFSWWAAWLGEKTSSVVIAPQKWFKSEELKNEDLVPKRWIRI
jgi:hypothetical protein